jgi:hypothetical protein
MVMEDIALRLLVAMKDILDHQYFRERSFVHSLVQTEVRPSQISNHPPKASSYIGHARKGVLPSHYVACIVGKSHNYPILSVQAAPNSKAYSEWSTKRRT